MEELKQEIECNPQQCARKCTHDNRTDGAPARTGVGPDEWSGTVARTSAPQASSQQASPPQAETRDTAPPEPEVRRSGLFGLSYEVKRPDQ